MTTTKNPYISRCQICVFNISGADSTEKSCHINISVLSTVALKLNALQLKTTQANEENRCSI